MIINDLINEIAIERLKKAGYKNPNLDVIKACDKILAGIGARRIGPTKNRK